MLEVLLNVLAVIGIIVVGGFVVVFLGNLLLNVLSSDSKEKKTNETNNQPANVEPQQITYAQVNEPSQLNYTEEPLAEEYQEVDFSKAEQEQSALNQNQELDDAYAKLRAEEEAFRQERLKFMEEKQKAEEEAKKAAEEQAQEEVKEDAQEDDDINLDDIFFDEDEELVDEPAEETEEAPVEEEAEEIAEEEVAEETVEETEEPVEEEVAQETEEVTEETEETVEEAPVEEEVEAEEEVAPVDDERLKELEAELEKQRAELEEYKKRAEEAENKLANEPVVAEVSDANLTLEEYEARLETLTNRLKANEKDLKAVKKEYLPLARVRKSLENDKKKLRRREALVAKQKVVLYGVNNYGDIDEEKAKKLAEDLDLLDGLKVSVAHCEEVMNQNKDRLPILENTYNILVDNNNAIKSDIEETKAKIEELKANAGDVDNNSDAE